MKKTVVLGASPNQNRYAFKAVNQLLNHSHDAIPVGIKKGEIANKEIKVGQPKISDVNTVSIYLSVQNQKVHYDYILSLQPKRVIFNPGSENEELKSLLESKGIEVVEGCTLVMLSIGTF